jgi:hypothetical protein
MLLHTQPALHVFTNAGFLDVECDFSGRRGGAFTLYFYINSGGGGGSPPIEGGGLLYFMKNGFGSKVSSDNC